MHSLRRPWPDVAHLCQRLQCKAGVLAWMMLVSVSRAAADGDASSSHANGPATQPVSSDVQTLLESIRAKHKLPALAGAIVEGNRLVAAGAVGRRKAGASDPVTVEDRFHLGSCTKSITATLIGLLVEEGKLTWNTTVAEVFPELKAKFNPGFLSVTVAQLLRHRSGLKEDTTPDALFIKMRLQLNGPIIQQREQAVEWLLAQAPTTQPGSRMQYSNSGYVIAGAMAERVTGKSWEDLLTERLFRPLGMKTAGFGTPGVGDEIDQPYGHVGGLFGLKSIERGPLSDNPPWLGPAGTVHASMGDWARYISLHLEGIHGRSRLIKPQTLAALYALGGRDGPASPPAKGWTAAETLVLMQGPPTRLAADSPEGYAAGWGLTHRGWGGTVLTHAGSNGAWFAVVWMAPQKNFAVLAAANMGGDKAATATDEAAGALIERLLTGRRAATAPAAGPQ